MIRTLGILLLLTLWTAPGMACDTNLLELVTGRAPGDDFTRLIVTMASQTQDIGKTIPTPDLAKQHLDALMKSWVEFDNRFSQKPPAWAINDPEWTAKIKSMADLIGGIKKGMGQPDQPVHFGVTTLHRRLISLFAAQPLDPLKKRLMRLNEWFGRLTQLLQGDGGYSPAELVGSITIELKELPPQIPVEANPFLIPLALEVENLQDLVGKGGKPAERPVRLSILKAEELFKEFNGRLNTLSAGK